LTRGETIRKSKEFWYERGQTFWVEEMIPWAMKKRRALQGVGGGTAKENQRRHDLGE